MADDSARARAQLEKAAAIVRYARKWFPHDGVTVIVHDRELKPGELRLAVGTTLPTRAATRLVFAETLARSLERDGVSGENAAEVVAAELLEFEKGTDA